MSFAKLVERSNNGSGAECVVSACVCLCLCTQHAADGVVRLGGWIDAFVCVCTFVRACACTCVCVCTYVRACACTCVCVCTYVRACACTLCLRQCLWHAWLPKATEWDCVGFMRLVCARMDEMG